MYTYSLCVFGLLYITPLILFGMIIFIKQMIKFNDFINERIFTRTIKIKQIIHINNLEADNLNCAINNV